MQSVKNVARCRSVTKENVQCRRLVETSERLCWQHGGALKPPNSQCTAVTRDLSHCRRPCSSSLQNQRCSLHADARVVPDFADPGGEASNQIRSMRRSNASDFPGSSISSTNCSRSSSSDAPPQAYTSIPAYPITKKMNGKQPHARDANRNRDRSVKMSPEVEVRYYRESSPPREVDDSHDPVSNMAYDDTGSGVIQGGEPKPSFRQEPAPKKQMESTEVSSALNQSQSMAAISASLAQLALQNEERKLDIDLLASTVLARNEEQKKDVDLLAEHLFNARVLHDAGISFEVNDSGVDFDTHRKEAGDKIERTDADLSSHGNNGSDDVHDL